MQLNAKIVMLAMTLSLAASAGTPNTGTYYERAANGLVTCYLSGFDIGNRAFYDGGGCSYKAAGKALVDLDVTVPADMEIQSTKTVHADKRYANPEHYTGKISFQAKGKTCAFTFVADFTDNPEETGDADMLVDGPVICK